jgi:hypothetical protein
MAECGKIFNATSLNASALVLTSNVPHNGFGCQLQVAF